MSSGPLSAPYLLSGITLAEAQQKAPPWPGGPEQGKQPSIASLGRIRLRLRIEERVTRIEEAAVARRVTRELLRRLVKKTDQETVLDEAMTLIGEQMIDACLASDGPSRMAGAWLLLRRADQRRYDQRTAVFQGQVKQETKQGDGKLPPLSEQEREDQYRAILGMNPRKKSL